MNIRAALIFVGLLSLLVSAANVRAEDWQYSMRPGDDLWSIARKYCGSAKKATDIAKYNEVPNPADVRAGTRINIPVNWLVFEPSSASIIETNNQVTRITVKGEKAQAAAGDMLYMGDVVETGDGAAIVQFADGSTIAIQPHSKVLFNKLTAFGPAGMVDTHLRFSYGRGTATVQQQNRGDRFRVQTPEGIAAVRGTVFRMGRERGKGGFTNTETLTGLVEFEQDVQATSVPGGFGVAASSGGVVKEQLLPAPTWQTAAGEIGVSAVLEWGQLDGAQSYAVTWADADNPGVVVHRATTLDARALVEVAPGSYTAGVRGISASGIEGLDSSIALAVRGQAPELAIATPGNNGEVSLAWQHADATASDYVVVLTNTSSGKTIERTAQAPSLAVALPPGNYAWNVAATDSARSVTTYFDLKPASITDVSIDKRGKNLSLSWSGNDNADQYHLVLTPEKAGIAPIEITTTEPRAEIEVADFGNYRLSLASAQGDLKSSPRYETVNVARRPWWLFLFALPILI